MLYIFFGSDDFSKQAYVHALSKKHGAELVWWNDAQAIPATETLTAQDLFSSAKMHVLKGMLAKVLEEQQVLPLKHAANHIVCIEESIDKRVAKNKQLLADSEITSKEFTLPGAGELPIWIIKRAQELGVAIEPEAAQQLATFIVGDGEGGNKYATPKYSLWQVDNEIQKLYSYTDGQRITKDAVQALVPETHETAVFDIINAIAEKQRSRIFNLYSTFFKETTGDDKAKIIQLNSILAEQLRNIVIVKGFMERRTPDAEILEATKWKSGRPYVVKKHAAKFDTKQVLSVLQKLESLDIELKSSSVPPRVLLDLITAQL